MGRPAHTPIAAKQARLLRRRMTVSEARLWTEIRGRSRGARFRRHVPIGFWIADFAFLDPRLVIEVDDISHEFRDESIRTEYFESQGFSVLRFSNRRVALELREVVGTLEGWLEYIHQHGVAPE